MNIKNEKIKKAYEGSYYTIEGAGGKIEDWINGYNKLFAESNIGEISDYVIIKGKEMNDEFDLEGRDIYKNNLTILAFPLDGLDVGKLAMFKLRMQDRWFDDIVDNLVPDEEYDF